MRRKALKILVENNPRDGLFIASQKTSRWQPEKVQIALPVDRPNGHISDSCASG